MDIKHSNRELAEHLSSPFQTTYDHLAPNPENLSKPLPKQIGPYPVQSELGSDKLGSVYLAKDPATQQTVAIRWMAQADPRTRDQFQQDSYLLCQLNHPALVSVLRSGEQEGRPYFAMEYVQGTSLSSTLRDIKEKFETSSSMSLTPFTFPFASRSRSNETENYGVFIVRIFLEIAESLAYVHRQRFVHGNLSPNNILIDADGRPKLCDLYLWHTRSTSAYSSPEQRRGEEVTVQSDIFSLGATFYEAITLQTAGEDPLLPSKIDIQIPRALEQVLLKCLQKDPAERFQTAEQLVIALRNCCWGISIQTRQDQGLFETKKKPRYVKALGGIAAMAMLATGYLLISGNLDLAEAAHSFLSKDYLQLSRASKRLNQNTEANNPERYQLSENFTLKPRTTTHKGMQTATVANSSGEEKRLSRSAVLEGTQLNQAPVLFDIPQDHPALYDKGFTVLGVMAGVGKNFVFFANADGIAELDSDEALVDLVYHSSFGLNTRTPCYPYWISERSGLSPLKASEISDWNVSIGKQTQYDYFGTLVRSRRDADRPNETAQYFLLCNQGMLTLTPYQEDTSSSYGNRRQLLGELAQSLCDRRDAKCRPNYSLWIHLDGLIAAPIQNFLQESQDALTRRAR